MLLGTLLVVLAVVGWKFGVSGVLTPAPRPAGAPV
jgi:hypothetical protein